MKTDKQNLTSTEVNEILSANGPVETDRLKDAFIHHISHEIRTPMNSIIGFSELMENPNLKKKEQKQYAKLIRRNATRLLSVIDRLLLVSECECGQVTLKEEDIDVTDFCNELYHAFPEHLPDPPPDVEFLFDTGLSHPGTIIRTDRFMLTQVLSNLLDNAFRFTEHGHVCFGFQPKAGCVRFFVKDTGIGIPYRLQKAVFDLFTKADECGSKPGAGLGLYLCRAYVQRMGGSIQLESVPGMGSVFYVSVPCR